MICPRCEKPSLDERDRDGVTIDVCTSCRGIWFDRGELEKLIARTTQEIEQLERDSGGGYAEPRPEPRPVVSTEQSRPGYEQHARDRDYRDRDYRDRDYRDDHRRKYPRKKSWVESLGDIFD
jgi:Zn-finger nucleic acid-binding protein